MGEIAVRFARRLHATGIDTIDGIDTAGAHRVHRRTIPHRRRPERGHPPLPALSTVRALFRTGRQLGVVATDPTLDIVLPALDLASSPTAQHR